MLISKPFRIATEGQTTDGRKITREWIDQMAATYDKGKYGARIWLEHLRGLIPGMFFDALGDVVDVEARDVQVDGQPRRALFARINPTPELVALNQRRQKVYTSIEVDPDFAGSGQAYLVGLGVTDSPASLGTDMLAFSTQHPGVFSGRKLKPENLFAEAIEAELEFEERPDERPSLLERIREMFAGHRGSSDQRFADVDAAVTALAEEVQALKARPAGADPAAFATLQQAHADLLAAFTALKAQLEETPAAPTNPLPPATGGTGATHTDC